MGVFVVYIDTGSSVPNIPWKSRGLADEDTTFLTEWNDSKQPYWILIHTFYSTWSYTLVTDLFFSNFLIIFAGEVLIHPI